jgi:hypothetical protein
LRNAVPFLVAGYGGGLTYARFRLSTAGGLSPLGAAADGEVEDYQVNIVTPAAPTISTVLFNGGGDVTLADSSTVSLLGQSSVVKQILVTFDTGVTLDAGAFGRHPDGDCHSGSLDG